MFCDFDSIFHPTEQQQEKQNALFRKIVNEAIKQHSCNACRFAEFRKTQEIEGIISNTYCSLTNKLKVDTIKENCDEWELNDDYAKSLDVLKPISTEILTNTNEIEHLIDILEESEHKEKEVN